MAIQTLLLLAILSQSFMSTLLAETETHQLEVFDKAHLYFGSGVNQRTLEKSVSFSERDAATAYRVELQLRLDCPNQRCDYWDRKGAISLIDQQGQEFEILRFVTPYRVGATWSVDVSDLAPLFVGTQTMRIFIDTWVGPGHPQGDGWLVDARLRFTPSETQQLRPVAVLPIWQPQSLEYGNPEAPARLDHSVDLELRGVRKLKLRAFITGHGQGNSENCAEFCQKSQTFTLGDWTQTVDIWRDNCADTVTDGPQMGTWIYSRSGWCPGDYVRSLELNIPKTTIQDGTETLSWIPETYINEKRGDYNNGGHTQPYYRVSASLILFE